MIEKNEIIKLAKESNLDLSIIEKDYVLGWMLASIQNQRDLFQNWLLLNGGQYINNRLACTGFISIVPMPNAAASVTFFSSLQYILNSSFNNFIF